MRFSDCPSVKWSLAPRVCVPVLFGYPLGEWWASSPEPWGICWLTILAEEKRNLPSLTALAIPLMGVAASSVFVHPKLPEPWTSEVHDYSLPVAPAVLSCYTGPWSWQPGSASRRDVFSGAR